jgi:uncharacterized protein
LLKRKTFFVLSVTALLLLCGACGKKGLPIPKGRPFPAPIADLGGEVKDGVLFLSFSIPTRNQDGSPLTNLAGFKIQKVCGTCVGGFELLKDIRLTDARGYTIAKGRLYVYDNDLRPGYEYIYKVIPYLENGLYSDASNLFSIKWQSPPGPPSGIKAASGDRSAQLTWTAQNDLLYNVYRLDGDLYPLFPLNNAPLLVDNFTDTGLQNGVAYRYEVRALRIEGGIRWEGEGASITATPVDRTPPAPPRNLAAAKKDGAVTLAWVPSPDPDVLGYTIYRIENGETVKLNPQPIKETMYVDPKPGVQRYVSYYVTAVDNAGNESEPSREAVIILTE